MGPKRRSARLAAKRKRKEIKEEESENESSSEGSKSIEIEPPNKKQKLTKYDDDSKECDDDSSFPKTWNTSDDEIESVDEYKPLPKQQSRKAKKTKSKPTKRKKKKKKSKNEKAESMEIVDSENDECANAISIEELLSMQDVNISPIVASKTIKKKKTKKRKRKSKAKGDYNCEQMRFVFETLDIENNGVLSLQNILNGFATINQSDAVNVGLAKRMLIHANKQQNNDNQNENMLTFDDFLAVCRFANLPM